MSISITVAGLQQVRAHINAIKNGLDPQVNRALDSIGNQLEHYIKTSKLSGNPLHVRSRKLRGSITHRREGSTEIVGTNIIYAPIQEFGKDPLVPVNKKWLTIPHPAGLSKTLTPAGVLRMTAAEWKLTGKTFIKKNIIFLNNGKQFAPTPLFILKKAVTIPPKHYMRNSLREQKEQIMTKLNAAVARSLRK